jgi:hypothetical protein
MRNKQEFAHLEALEQYPDGFQDNVKTQRKLIQNAVNRLQGAKKITQAHRYGFLGLVLNNRAAAIFLLLVSVIGVFWTAQQLRRHQSQRISASATVQQKSLKPVVQNRVVQSQKLKVLPKRRQQNRTKIEKEIAKELPATEGFVVANLDTPTTQRPLMSELVAVSKQPLFEKKQRFKQFEFQPKKPSAQAKKSPPSTEFFVFRDGHFKIVSTPSEQQFIQFIKPQ